MRKIIVISFVFTVFSWGCSVSGKLRNENPASAGTGRNSNSISEIVNNNLSKYDFFIQRADVRLTQENVDVHFNAAIRFRKPDSLLVSVKTKTGIEAGRALITGDTLIINDRINRKILTGDAHSISNKYGIDPYYIFALLGDLIINESEMQRGIECTRGIGQSKFQVNDKRIEYTIDCSRGKIVKAYFEGDVRSGNILLNYGDFISINKIRIPQRIEISDDMNNINILIEIRKIVMPWDGPLRFIINSGYKVIKIR